MFHLVHTTGTATQRGKNESVDTFSGKREFLKSVETEWQTLLKHQAARVLSVEETAHARDNWPDRTVDTRWARIWKPNENAASGRRAKARFIMKGFADIDFLDIESHFPTLTRGFYDCSTHAVSSHGHKLQFGDVHRGSALSLFACHHPRSSS